MWVIINEVAFHEENTFIMNVFSRRKSVTSFNLYLEIVFFNVLTLPEVPLTRASVTTNSILRTKQYVSSHCSSWSLV